ncbi:MAG: hypothetical protein ACPGN3_09520 [Opitutales bacterium]
MSAPGDKAKEVIWTDSPTPRLEGTVILLLCMMVAWLFVPESDPYSVANHYAKWVLGGLGLAILFELNTMGFSRLIRVDWVCLVIFYALSYLEFLFSQPELNRVSTVERTSMACGLFNLGFVTIAISRHFVTSRKVRYIPAHQAFINYKILVGAFWAAFAIGFFHIFIAVDFSISRAIDAMMGARFSQPWGRGRLGDWKALLVELGLFVYLIPPIFGALLALRKKVPLIHLLTTAPVFLFTIFYGFSSGTRNIFGTYMITFIVAYLINQTKIRWAPMSVFIGICLFVTAWGSYHMLEFRNIGLKRYIKGEYYQSEKNRETLFVDFNLHYLGVLAEAFPERHDFLGTEVPVWALVKPIPRAVWAGKPEGLSVSIEEATGVEQMSVATTWVGESYMAFGLVGVVGTGVLIGIVCGLWNRRGSQYEIPLKKIIFASGFFAAALSMRSTFWFTTAILPTVAMISGYFVYRNFFTGSPGAKRVRRSRSFTLPSDS